MKNIFRVGLSLLFSSPLMSVEGMCLAQRDYGIDGSGKKDVASDVIRADAECAKEGGVLFFESGRYLIDSSGLKMKYSNWFMAGGPNSLHGAYFLAGSGLKKDDYVVSIEDRNELDFSIKVDVSKSTNNLVNGVLIGTRQKPVRRYKAEVYVKGGATGIDINGWAGSGTLVALSQTENCIKMTRANASNFNIRVNGCHGVSLTTAASYGLQLSGSIESSVNTAWLIKDGGSYVGNFYNESPTRPNGSNPNLIKVIGPKKVDSLVLGGGYYAFNPKDKVIYDVPRKFIKNTNFSDMVGSRPILH